MYYHIHVGAPRHAGCFAHRCSCNGRMHSVGPQCRTNTINASDHADVHVLQQSFAEPLFFTTCLYCVVPGCSCNRKNLWFRKLSFPSPCLFATIWHSLPWLSARPALKMHQWSCMMRNQSYRPNILNMGRAVGLQQLWLACNFSEQNQRVYNDAALQFYYLEMDRFGASCCKI